MSWLLRINDQLPWLHFMVSVSEFNVTQTAVETIKGTSDGKKTHKNQTFIFVSARVWLFK